MKITEDTVLRLTIDEVPGMYSIRVMIEDIEPGKGRINIDCNGKSWVGTWHSTGNKKISDFLSSCNTDYIAGKLSTIKSKITDEDGIREAVQREIIAKRRGRRYQMPGTKELGCKVGRNEITAEEARELWDESEYADFYDDGKSDSDLLEKVFGEEWWYEIPTKPNPEYTNLIEIITTVQEALKVSAA